MKKYLIFTVLLFSFFWNNISYSYAEGTDSSNSKEEVKQLKLNWVKVVDKNKVELEFDSEIDTTEDNDISVRKIWDNSDEIFVSDYEVNNKNIIITLEKNLESNTDYEVIIFAVTWKNWWTITSGLDWAFQFNSWDLSVFEKEDKIKKENKEEKIEKNKTEDNNKNVKIKTNENNIELNSAGISKEKTNTWKLEQSANLAWKEIKDEDLKNNIEVVAAKKDKLAKTGPEDTLLVILALILWALIFYAINQRKNNKI